VTEEEACRIFAVAWNTLAADILIDALDDNVRYTSQTVWTDMNGKAEVGQYLRSKMVTIRSTPSAKVFAQLAETQPYPMYPNPPRPCVVLGQGSPEDLTATVLFEVSDSCITAIDLCIIPPPETTRRSNLFPIE